jgi:hypothetical protein
MDQMSVKSVEILLHKTYQKEFRQKTASYAPLRLARVVGKTPIKNPLIAQNIDKNAEYPSKILITT